MCCCVEYSAQNLKLSATCKGSLCPYDRWDTEYFIFQRSHSFWRFDEGWNSRHSWQSRICFYWVSLWKHSLSTAMSQLLLSWSETVDESSLVFSVSLALSLQSIQTAFCPDREKGVISQKRGEQKREVKSKQKCLTFTVFSSYIQHIHTCANWDNSTLFHPLSLSVSSFLVLLFFYCFLLPRLVYFSFAPIILLLSLQNEVSSVCGPQAIKVQHKISAGRLSGGRCTLFHQRLLTSCFWVWIWLTLNCLVRELFNIAV